MSLRDQFLRRWQLLRALESGSPRSAEELLELLVEKKIRKRGKQGRSWSLRTLQRDLAELIRVGFPVEGVRSGRKLRYRLLEAYLASVPCPLKPSEWAAVYYVLSRAREMSGSPLKEEPLDASVNGVFARLCEVVPAALRVYAEGIEPRYAGVVGSLREQGRQRKTVGVLSSAIEHGRPIRLLASRPGEIRRRWWRVDPYLLQYEGGGFHLLGREAGRGTLEVWPLPGIESVRVERGGFQLPLELDLQAVLSERLREANGAACRVRVRFRKGAALQAIVAFMEGAFGPTRVLHGAGAPQVTVQTNDLWSLKRWLLAFGAEAEVVSPKELRLAVAQDLEKALGRYRKTADRSKDAEPR